MQSHKRNWLAVGAAVLVMFACSVFQANAQVVCTGGGDPVAANAAKACWTNATTDVAGTPLPATGVGSLKTTRVQRARMAAATAGCDFAAPAEPIEVKDFAATVGGFLYTNLADGRHCFRARHINNEGVMSDWSPTVYKIVSVPKPPGKPNAPSLSVDTNAATQLSLSGVTEEDPTQ